MIQKKAGRWVGCASVILALVLCGSLSYIPSSLSGQKLAPPRDRSRGVWGILSKPFRRPPSSSPSRGDLPEPSSVRRELNTHEYADPSKKFRGVDLEHFVHAQYRLAGRLLSSEQLQQVMRYLGIRDADDRDQNYRNVYQALIKKGYTQEVVDLINANTYEDPRLAITIIGQSPNPRAQGVYEAVANSLDALGHEIGQFGKGVKQILDWLQASGGDRLDVYTSQGEEAYQLTILKAASGQNYIQIREISFKEFQAVSGSQVNHGTVVRLTLQDSIPLREEDRDTWRRNSQEGILEGVRRTFPVITSIRILTQKANERQPTPVNGFGEKRIISAAGTRWISPSFEEGKEIAILLTDQTITIKDNGHGMDAVGLSRMFVPKEGSKQARLTPEEVQQELEKVEVVHDRTLPNRVSFARGNRAVVSVDISDEILPEAVIQGELMVECGRLIDVPESWDQMILHPELAEEEGQKNRFQMAIEQAAKQILADPSLSDVGKVQYINTIVVGLDHLIGGNENHAHVVKQIRRRLRQELSEIVQSLEKEEYLFLPHQRQFAKLAIPEGKKAIYLHEHLFRWQGVASLKAMGAKVVPWVTLGGEEKKIPLLIIPFQQEAVARVKRFHRGWFRWREEDRFPVLIEPGRFVAVPPELGNRIDELAAKNAVRKTTPEEEKKLKSLLQRINILTAEKVITSYEAGEVPENLRLEIPAFEVSPGEADAGVIRSFLTRPPAGAEETSAGRGAVGHIPQDAHQGVVLLENGSMVEVETGKEIPLSLGAEDQIQEVIYSKNEVLWRVKSPSGFYWRLSSKGDDGEWGFVNIGKEDMIISPDKRSYFRKVSPTLYVIAEIGKGSYGWLAEGFPIELTAEELTSSRIVSNGQFSHDSRYFVYVEENKSGKFLKAVDLIERKIVKKMPIEGEIEFAISPFASQIVFVRDARSNLLTLVDLRNGRPEQPVVTQAKDLYSDNSGAWVAIVDANGKLAIYVERWDQLVASAALDGEEIESVTTYWNGNVPSFFSLKTKSGKIRWFDSDGWIEDWKFLAGQSEYRYEYWEQFSSNGDVLIFCTKGVPDRTGRVLTSHAGIERFNPIDRLKGSGVYKHPHFPLVIDNNDPEFAKVYDPVTGEEAPLRGEILAWNSSEGILVLRDHKTGGINPWFLVNGIPPDRLHDDEFRIQYAAADATPASVFIGRIRNQYFLVRGEQLMQKENWVSLAGISPSEYSSVSFDGRYFVFLNPKAGDVVYVDPKDAGTPVFVGARKGLFSGSKPADAPMRYVLVGNRVWDSEQQRFIDWGGDPEEHPGAIERIDDSTFWVGGINKAAPSKGGFSPRKYQVVRINGDGDPVVLWEKTEVRDPKAELESIRIEFLRGGWILTGKTSSFFGEASRPQRRFGLENFETGEVIPSAKDSQEIHLSSSGQFSVHEDAAGNLVYYDHNETNPSPRLIRNKEEYQDYRVDPYADVVLIQDQNGYYDRYSLMPEYEFPPGGDNEYIEIDPSGLIIIEVDTEDDRDSDRYGVKRVSWLTLFDYRLGIGVNEDPIQVSRDLENVYIYDDNGTVLTVIDRKTKEIHQYEGRKLDQFRASGFHLPRFWEEYGLKGKQIWDSHAGRFYPIGDYTELVSTEHHPAQKSYKIEGKFLIVYRRNETPGEENDIEITDLESGEKYTDKLVSKFEEAQFFSFEGGKVLFCSFKDKAAEVLGSKVTYTLPMLTDKTEKTKSVFNSLQPHGVVLNQTRTALLMWGYHSVKSSKREFTLIRSDGTVTEITSFIPEGFELWNEANGRYFISRDSATGQVLYLDPETIPTALAAAESARASDSKVILERWSEEILPKRNPWILQGREAYQPFLELVPEEFRAEAARAVEPALRRLYQQEEEEIRRRFDQALQAGSNVGFDSPLPFDFFAGRMRGIVSALSGHLDLIEEEETSLPDRYIFNLFSGLFEIAADSELAIPEWSEEVFLAIGMGYPLKNPKGMEELKTIAKLIEVLRNETSPRVSLSEIAKIIHFLAKAGADSKDAEKHEIVMKQLQRILNLASASRAEMLRKLTHAFSALDETVLGAYLENPSRHASLGDARPFVIFLTHDVEMVKEKERWIPQGEEVHIPDGGIYISQLIELEQQREKRSGETTLMEIETLIDYLNEGRPLPEPSEALDMDILRNQQLQRASGASRAEIPQNSLDATQGKQGELVVEFYRQRGEDGEEEFVEEAADNGTGALQEMALLIPKSTKELGRQIDLTGFFGTGKYTIFEEVDRVEIITRNQERAYLFGFTVFKDSSGRASSIRLTRIRRLQDENVPQGVTVRRIKKAENTIPELDQMLAQRSWKIFAGLAQGERGEGESFTIYFVDEKGEREPLSVKKKILSEAPLVGYRRGERGWNSQEEEFGPLRILSVEDFPLQVVDKAGLRISEIKESYLTLIHPALRKHLAELEVVIQIPLLLIRTRSSFENEPEYLPLIQKYVAIEFYKALAYKTLTAEDKFVFEGLASDWETSAKESYWGAIRNDPWLLSLAERSNAGRYGEISEEELRQVAEEPHDLGKGMKFVRLLLLLEVPRVDRNHPERKESLFLRRLAIQERINAERVQQEIQSIGNQGFHVRERPPIESIPYFDAKIEVARKQASGNIPLEALIISPENYTPEEAALVRLAYSVGKHFGIEQVLIVSDLLGVDGRFCLYGGKRTIIFNRTIARLWGQGTPGIQDTATDTVVHELGHLVELLISEAGDERVFWEKGHFFEKDPFTHQPVGTFAQAMKFVAALWLANEDSLAGADSGNEMIVEESL